MGLSFIGEAAQDRDCGDHSLHPGGASSSAFARPLNNTPFSATTPSGEKRPLAVGIHPLFLIAADFNRFARKNAMSRRRAVTH
jgi:hypothetical protein